jgi:DNA-binding transcriptional ArsR family regulator
MSDTSSSLLQGSATPLAMEGSVRRACDTLTELANPQRLQILCLLTRHGEVRVSELHEAVTLSQSALSQHLARLRDKGIVAARKEGLAVYYRIAREDVARVLEALHEVYCSE